jgi:hypothetical protein
VSPVIIGFRAPLEVALRAVEGTARADAVKHVTSSKFLANL